MPYPREDIDIKFIGFVTDDWYPLIVNGTIYGYEVNPIKGKIRNALTKYVLSAKPDGKPGYIRCILRDPITNKATRFSLHRIVACMFIPNPDNLPEVNHIDGCKTNNSVYNLEWCTFSENIQHTVRTGLQPILKGEFCPAAKHDEKTIRAVCEMLQLGTPMRDIVSLVDIHRSTITELISGRKWRSVTKDYDFSAYPYLRSSEFGSINSTILRKLRNGKSEKHILDWLIYTKGIPENIAMELYDKQYDAFHDVFNGILCITGDKNNPAIDADMI